MSVLEKMFLDEKEQKQSKELGASWKLKKLDFQVKNSP